MTARLSFFAKLRPSQVHELDLKAYERAVPRAYSSNDNLIIISHRISHSDSQRVWDELTIAVSLEFFNYLRRLSRNWV